MFTRHHAHWPPMASTGRQHPRTSRSLTARRGITLRRAVKLRLSLTYDAL